MKRRMLAFMLSSSMVLGAVPTAFAAESISVEDVQGAQTVEADSTTQSGYCGAEKDGKNVKWTLKDGVLTISGKGEMIYPDNGEELLSPWYSYSDQITSAVIENGVTNIYTSAFYECSNLRSVTIPNSVTEIGHNAFQYTALATISIPDSVTTIGSNAFYGCNNLTSVTVPSSVTKVGQGAFAACENLTEILVDDANTAYISVDGVLFTKDMTEIVAYPYVKSGSSYTVPDGVTKICWTAFDCKNLTEVILPAGLESIEPNAFRDSKITSISIPSSVTYIGMCAFADCNELKEIKFYGNAPDFSKLWYNRYNVFSSSKAIAYYPENATGWTSELFSSEWSGDITWTAWDAENEHIHSFDEGKVTTEPTCSEKGVKTYTCTICSYTKTEEIATVEHTYDEGKVTTEPTCSTEGVKTYTCTKCGQTKTEDIATVAHTWTEGTAVPATLKENGHTAGYECSVCGAVKEQDTIYRASKIKLSKTSYKYNGRKKTPKAVVKDSRGKTISSDNYTVKYSSGRRKVGKYKVTITFTGENYTGTKTLTFRIKR